VTNVAADVAIVGSGVSGLLVARSLLSAGRSVVMLERGALKTHAEQLRDGVHAADVPGARPLHETAPGSPDYDWQYVLGVGGSTLHFEGQTPRFHPNDFRLRSEYGVGEDWPIGYDDLEPYYEKAEGLLGVAGGPVGRHGRRASQPPHPLSPADRLIAPYLGPYGPLPSVRPTQAIGSRPACCGSAVCELCPVDARFTPLNSLQDVLRHPRLELRQQTVAARLRLSQDKRRVDAIECIDASGNHVAVEAGRNVLCASGFENPALLLRSGLDRADAGRFLFDHKHATVEVVLRRPAGAGMGASLSTGASQAFRDGPFRSSRGSAFVLVNNPGINLAAVLAQTLRDGRRGKKARTYALDRWRRTLALDVCIEDLPRAERRVTLSPNKDAFGLPKVRVAYAGVSRYHEEGVEAVRAGVASRLAPLGVEDVRVSPGPEGGHLLGTCRFGSGDTGVVDADLRHLDVANLWVAGGSCFPAYSAAHPTLTIAALAIRLSEQLAGVPAKQPAAA
jgi:choline dehydrogenase-like flavoprotein